MSFCANARAIELLATWEKTKVCYILTRPDKTVSSRISACFNKLYYSAGLGTYVVQSASSIDQIDCIHLVVIINLIII